jgi:hypothetical protein
MNLKSLHRDAVRRAGQVEKVSGLLGAELKSVASAAPAYAIVGDDTPRQPQPVRVDPGVTPEQCAIHLYYPQDVTQ